MLSNTVLLVLPLALMMLSVPVYIALLSTSTLVAVFMSGLPIASLHQMFYGGLDKYTLLAIPFFVFAGEMMGRGGVSDRILDWVQSLFGRLPGSTAISTVGASTVFGAISGSSPATVAAIGKLTYPRLIEERYDLRFAIGLTTSSGAIASVIPPSLTMIVYGAATEVSVSDLFLAGIVPGILIAAVVIVYTILVATPHSRSGHAVSFRKVLRQTYRAAWALGTPIIILGGIYTGIFTPTEAGGVASVYALIVSLFLYRLVGWKEVGEIAAEAAYLTAKILVVVGAANLYGWLITISGLPQQLVATFDQATLGPVAALLVVNIIFLIVGSFIDPASAILILSPLLLPLITALGIDPIHFGIIVTINLSIGMFTPPFGLNIFVAQTVLGGSYGTIVRGVLPFIAIYVVCLLIITFFPTLSLLLL